MKGGTAGRPRKAALAVLLLHPTSFCARVDKPELPQPFNIPNGKPDFSADRRTKPAPMAASARGRDRRARTSS
jgi:hypothetical protein